MHETKDRISKGIIRSEVGTVVIGLKLKLRLGFKRSVRDEKIPPLTLKYYASNAIEAIFIVLSKDSQPAINKPL